MDEKSSNGNEGGGVPECMYCLGGGPMCKVMRRTFDVPVCLDCCVCGVYIQCR